MGLKIQNFHQLQFDFRTFAFRHIPVQCVQVDGEMSLEALVRLDRDENDRKVEHIKAEQRGLSKNFLDKITIESGGRVAWQICRQIHERQRTVRCNPPHGEPAETRSNDETA